MDRYVFTESFPRVPSSHTLPYTQILADTYQAMPSYRLCTADGVVQLTEGLHSRLKELLQRELEKNRS